jgi:hypothetical protein
MFTCRVCHVDIGFAMKAGARTSRRPTMRAVITAAPVITAKWSRKENPSSQPAPRKRSWTTRNDASAATPMARKSHPILTSSNSVNRFPKNASETDWIGKNRRSWDSSSPPLFFLASPQQEILSPSRRTCAKPKVEGMPDIIFSHKKHTVWNGCELCHPDIFMGVKRGTVKYSMVDISQGQVLWRLPYHGGVSFDGLPALPFQTGTTLRRNVMVPTAWSSRRSSGRTRRRSKQHFAQERLSNKFWWRRCYLWGSPPGPARARSAGPPHWQRRRTQRDSRRSLNPG